MTTFTYVCIHVGIYIIINSAKNFPKMNKCSTATSKLRFAQSLRYWPVSCASLKPKRFVDVTFIQSGLLGTKESFTLLTHGLSPLASPVATKKRGMSSSSDLHKRQA